MMMIGLATEEKTVYFLSKQIPSRPLITERCKLLAEKETSMEENNVKTVETFDWVSKNCSKWKS